MRFKNISLIVSFIFLLTTPLALLANPPIKNIRPAASGGTFYPSDAKTLYATIQKLINTSPPLKLPHVPALIVPHAGYMYSGAIAADSFREIQKNYKRVFIIASNHNAKANLRGVSIPNFSHYQIPGAEIAISKVAQDFFKLPLFKNNPLAHTMHMIEVELPFLYYLNGYPQKPEFEIIPMILGHMGLEDIQLLANQLNHYNDGETLFVFSIDLSHYYKPEEAQKLDRYTIEAVMSRDSTALRKATTDGNQVLMTLVEMAKLNHWQPTYLSYKHSGHVIPGTTSVVGYTSILFHKPLELLPTNQEALLQYTQDIVTQAVTTNTQPSLTPQVLKDNPILNIRRATFVTLNKNGQLRGCIGNIYPSDSLHQSVQRSAYNATLKDTRFKPVSSEELKDLKLSVSILDYPQRLFVNQPHDYLALLKPGRDGVIIDYQGKRSTYLPQVWDIIKDPSLFLQSLCEKQGAPKDCWLKPETTIYKFEATVYGQH